MPTFHKMTILVADWNDEWNTADSIIDELDSATNLGLTVISEKTAKIEIDDPEDVDGHPLNSSRPDKMFMKELNRLFPETK